MSKNSKKLTVTKYSRINGRQLLEYPSYNINDFDIDEDLVIHTIKKMLSEDNVKIFKLLTHKIDRTDGSIVDNMYLLYLCIKELFVDGAFPIYIDEPVGGLIFDRLYNLLTYINYLDMYEVDMPNIITKLTEYIFSLSYSHTGAFGVRGYKVFKTLLTIQYNMGRTQYLDYVYHKIDSELDSFRKYPELTTIFNRKKITINSLYVLYKFIALDNLDDENIEIDEKTVEECIPVIMGYYSPYNSYNITYISRYDLLKTTIKHFGLDTCYIIINRKIAPLIAKILAE